MAKIVVHTDDLPDWAVHKEKVSHSYLDFLTEAVHPSPDGGGLVSFEDIMMRQQFNAALKGKSKAMTWLLRKIIKENADDLAACRAHPHVRIDGIHSFQPLSPVLEMLGCATVIQAEEDAGGTSRSELAPWFSEELERRCPARKLEPVKAWLDAGGEQRPRIHERDRHD